MDPKVEKGDDGVVILRRAGTYPIEIYSEKRICEFEEADRMTLAERRRLRRDIDGLNQLGRG